MSLRKQNRPWIFRLQFIKHLGSRGVVFKGPPKLKIVHVLFNSKILNTLHSVPMERPFSAGQPLIPQWKGSKVRSFPLLCLSVHQIFKSMPPGKLLRCNSKTLPFPLPEGGHRAGLWPGEVQEAGLDQLARVGLTGRGVSKQVNHHRG